jgi:hypothetical protein
VGGGKWARFNEYAGEKILGIDQNLVLIMNRHVWRPPEGTWWRYRR